MFVLNINNDSYVNVMVIFLLLSEQHPRWSYEGSRETKSHGEHEGKSPPQCL